MDELAEALLAPPSEQAASGAAVPASVRHAPTDAISMCTPLLERFERWVSSAKCVPQREPHVCVVTVSPQHSGILLSERLHNRNVSAGRRGT